MQKYTHLTLEQRYQISALLKSNISISEIAKQLGCHKSTISREIKRNTGKRGYRPKQANTLAKTRKANNHYQLNDFAKAYIHHLLEQKYSPEQIHGRLKMLGWQDVPSHETIYQYIYADKKTGGQLHTHLRCQKKYRKRYFKGYDRRGQIAHRQDISERLIIENTNGLVSQFLPKSMSFDKLSDEDIKAIEYNLNNHPRKVLGFRTPLEVKSSFGCVALQT